MFPYIILVINVTAVSEAAQPVLAYWSQGKKRKGGEQKRTTGSKRPQLMGIQRIL